MTRDSPSSAARRGDRLGLEIGEDVVLDDGEVVRGRGVQQAVRGLRRDRRAGRIVERGIGDVEARPMRRQRLGEERGSQARSACRARRRS